MLLEDRQYLHPDQRWDLHLLRLPRQQDNSHSLLLYLRIRAHLMFHQLLHLHPLARLRDLIVKVHGPKHNGLPPSGKFPSSHHAHLPDRRSIHKSSKGRCVHLLLWDSNPIRMQPRLRRGHDRRQRLPRLEHHHSRWFDRLVHSRSQDCRTSTLVNSHHLTWSILRRRVHRLLDNHTPGDLINNRRRFITHIATVRRL
jgi:hypothetical protein